MAFIDELTIYAKAGDGGDGVVRWRHEKFRPKAGPSGGDGGRGGDVIIKGVRDIHLLSKYRTQKEFRAENGGAGEKDSLHGKNGDHLYIALPIGSLVKHVGEDKQYELVSDGQEITILGGGRGGRGNESFKSSTNVTPVESTPGVKGNDADFTVELQLFADIGLIGLPNAGKTSLLNELTRARGKVADYPFTTLEPNLGEMHGYIIADIPGLIEGAAEGKGLGHKFLRHIKRTKVLAHLVSFENTDPYNTYELVRQELIDYDASLIDKKEVIILSKVDMVTDDEALKIQQEFKNKGVEVYTVSAYDDESVGSIAKILIQAVNDNALDDAE